MFFFPVKSTQKCIVHNMLPQTTGGRTIDGNGLLQKRQAKCDQNSIIFFFFPLQPTQNIQFEETTFYLQF